MATEAKEWESLLNTPPSDNFVCKYEGNFAQQLMINRPVVERLLNFAALDGRVLLNESHVKRPRSAPDGINSDGSVGGKGSLFWGERVQAEGGKTNAYVQIEPDSAGWVISVNGDLITEDLNKRSSTGLRNGQNLFAATFDNYLAGSLAKVVLKDKFTFSKDPYSFGRLAYSLSLLKAFIGVPWEGMSLLTELLIVGYLGGNGLQFLFTKDGTSVESQYGGNPMFETICRVSAPWRRNVKSIQEMALLPFEIDKLIASEGYLGRTRLKGLSLIKAASVIVEDKTQNP